MAFWGEDVSIEELSPDNNHVDYQPGAYRYEKVVRLRADDRPALDNSGVVTAGILHLEKQGFREGDRVRIITFILPDAFTEGGAPAQSG